MQSGPPVQTRTPAFGVNVIGFVSARLGIGVAARASVAALVNAKIPVAVVDLELPDGRSGYDTTWSHLRITNLEQLPHPVSLMHANPPEAEGIWQRFPAWFSQCLNCAVPFFELPDVPDSWQAHLARYDLVLAASDHIAGAIRNAISVPVRPYPIAADVKTVRPIARSSFGVEDSTFAFVTTWDTDSGLNRKNGIGALRAFANAFAGRPNVVLVLKVNGIARHPELERAIADMPAGSVRVVDRYLSYEEVLGLYASCDAFISLHRAEGLGLGLMEAMLLGKPVVATGWSGNMDFMDDACAALVRYTLTPVVDTQAVYGAGLFSRAQVWAEPDLLHASSLMVRLVDDAAYRQSIARNGQRRSRARREAFFSGSVADVLSAAYASARVPARAGG